MDIKSRKSYNLNELPFEDFRKIGISRDLLINMPKALIKPLMTGQMTQFFELKVSNAHGLEMSVPARLRMERDSNGKAQLKVYPIHREIKNDLGLTKRQIEQLKDGKTIRANVVKDGKQTLYYAKLDRLSNGILRAKVDDVAKSVPRAINGVELGRDQVQRLRDGNLIEMTVGKDKITAGVDLSSPTGFNVVKGDNRDWDMQQKIRWDMDNPGAVGYWQTTENGWQQLKVKEHEQGLDRQPEQIQPKKEHRSAGIHL